MLFGASPNTSKAPLLPKLRGQFAEFLNDGCLERLGTFIPVYQCRFAVRTSQILTNGAFLGGIESATFREANLMVRTSLGSNIEGFLAPSTHLQKCTHHIQ